MADEKVVITADSKGYEDAADKMANKNKKVKDSVKGIGKEIDTMAKGWIKSAVGMTAIVQGLRAIGDVQKQMRDQQAAASKERGEELVGVDVALAQTRGLTDEEKNQLRQAVASSQDRGAALQALQKAAGKPFTAQQLQAGVLSAGSGIMSQEETEMAFMTGTSKVGERLSQLSPEAREELSQRRKEQESLLKDAEYAMMQRRIDQRIREMEASGSFLDRVGMRVQRNIPFIGEEMLRDRVEESMTGKKTTGGRISDFAQMVSPFLMLFNNVPVNVRNVDKRPVVNGNER